MHFPDVITGMKLQGFDMAEGGRDLAAFIRDDLAKWIGIANEAGLRR